MERLGGLHGVGEPATSRAQVVRPSRAHLGHILGTARAHLGRISGASRAHAPADACAEALDLGGVGAGLLVGDLHERLERRVDGLAPQLADVGDRVVRARRAVLDVAGAAAPVAVVPPRRTRRRWASAY